MKKILFWPSVVLTMLAGCHRQPAVFTPLPSSATHIDFVNTPLSRPGLGILEYIYYYNGGGVAVGDINNDGLPDIYFTANSKGHNKLYLNRGGFQFEDITDRAAVAGTSDWCTGVTMADVNGDGFLDIYVCAVANTHGLQGHNELFINNGNGTFTESAARYGLAFSGFSTQAAFFDYDHDGDLDCFILNQSEHPNQHIVDTSHRHQPDPYSGGRLFRNDVVNGQSKFTDVTAQAGIYQSSLGYGLGLGIADLNNDGWEDIYIGNDFHENDYYYANRGDGTFVECGADHFRHYSRYSMGNDIADYNNDGQPDIVTVDMLPSDEKILKTYGNGEHLDTYTQKITRNGYQDQYSRNCLQVNNGDGASFSDIGLISGIAATDWSWSPLMADFDNDGKKDLFISSGIERRPLDLDFIQFFSNIRDPKQYGSPEQLEKTLLDKMPQGYGHPYLFQGNGHMHFTDVSAPWGTADLLGCFNGAAYADLDNDGRLDLVINCLNAPAAILKNNTPVKHYVSLTCKGSGLNTAGIGAKVWVFTGGTMQYQQLMTTRGFQSSSDPRLHFGLDSLQTIDSLLIVWPDQQYQLLKHVRADQHLVLRQKEARQAFVYRDHFPDRQQPSVSQDRSPNGQPVLTDISQKIQTGWRHKEDAFIDFNTQFLIPHMESTRGPRVAVADADKDGLEDIFVCGAKGQPGALLIQGKDGNFHTAGTAPFVQNAGSEGVDAVWFDANNDGSNDLYVVSGGNEYADGHPALADHLYINDGKGHFSEPMGALPSMLTNKSCVAVADVNNDGSQDIFVGGLTDAKRYGYPSPSYLLLNDGKGSAASGPVHFKFADTSVIRLNELGIITSCAFADVNKDGWPDLIVAGEWMRIKIFINHKGVFRESDISNSSGLWQSLYVTDVNGDGYPDVLAGNWGHNSKLYAGKDGPLKLYVKDFDNNGSVEQVMTYTIGGKEYSFLGKDQLELALPGLKKEHLTYDEVAGRTVDYLFSSRLDDTRTLNAVTLSSTCFINDGKGNFTAHVLPDELQLAPVFAFASVPVTSVASATNSSPTLATNKKFFLAAGNFYGVQPYEGRYDAMNPTLFGYDPLSGGFPYLSQVPRAPGEIRDAKWINRADGTKVLVLAVNNGPLVFLRP